ncbi:MAG: TrkA family potassium uptake protein [Clostridia bacterium]|nr:TrkA family potassium uptake protein [Clostridia bacterium]
MKSFLIIGMGTFGQHLCRELAKHKCEIVISDLREEPMEDLLPLVVSAKVCDCSKAEVLKTFDIPSFDVCFVCIDSVFQACLEITDQLRELGAKKIYSKADQALEAKFLLRSGADQIIFPERDAAARIAASESYDRIFDCIELTGNCSIFEVEPHPDWIGKSVGEMGFRKKYNLNIVATKTVSGLDPVLDPGYVFKHGEHVMVMGNISDVRKITK